MDKQNQDILNNTTIDSTATTLALSNLQGTGERRRISVRGVLCTLFCLGAALALSNWLVAGTPAPVAAQATTLEEECSNGIAVPDPQDNPGLVADCVTLLSIRDTLAGTALLEWNTSTPINYWLGVSVSNSRVTMLYLTDRGLTGSIPPALGNLSQLTYLYLTYNQLTGSIPPELGNLSKLEGLYLWGNQLTGSIPHTLGNLSQLTRLDLDYNQLTGSIPPELGNLSKLTRLDLDYNRLTGSIPPALGNLSQLQELELSDNQLTGSIPPELGNLSKLTRLDLDYNRLSGSIPPELDNLSKLSGLHLTDNQLTGSIPPELGNLSQLRHLDLDYNQLTGSIPPALGNLSELGDLHLADNPLSGCIPNALASVSNHDLANLGLPLCDQSTPIACAADCTTLLTIKDTLAGTASLHWNASAPLILWQGVTISNSHVIKLSLPFPYYGYEPLTGSIPPELGNLSELQELDLNDNLLTGSIPPALGNLSKLTELTLRGNELTGSIPPELGNLSQLQWLSLSGNQLRGCIPHALTNIWVNDLLAIGLPVCAQETPVPMPTIVSPVATPLAISPGTTQSISQVAIPSNQGHQTFLPLVQH